jgi:O-antigen/teichoic acid export membrane protein
MSLPMHEKRILADIERDLTALDPRLGRRMASFAGPTAAVYRAVGAMHRRIRLTAASAVLVCGIIALGALAVVRHSATLGAWSVTLAAATAGVVAVCAVGRDTDADTPHPSDRPGSR